MLELSALKFSANTDELKAAIGTMQQVKTAISSLEQAQAKAATQSSKASKAASDAAKAEAQAALAAIKLEKEKQKAIEASADATVSAGNRSISVLEKQEQVLQFMVQGYSRGQSSILATAKAAGAATDELAKLGSTLQSQRTLMGSDPFDKSLGALRALKNEFSVVKEQVRLYNAELGLTKKQSEDLARDKLRLIEASKIEGKSLFSVRDSVKELNMEYIRLAKSENDLVSQYRQNVKNTQDTAKANDYLEKELQKVRFAVDEQNASLNRGSANAIVRFENALKKSGKTVAEQKVLLDEYRKSLDKLQGAGGARATDYISRAVGPQLTDIIVGLSTGQSLMTVMMQQGGQLRDQFAMMGVAGAEMGAVMRTALSSMAVSVKDTAVAFGQLFVGGVVDAGKGIVNFTTELLRLDKVLDWNKRRLAALGEEGFTAIGNLGRIATLVNAAVGVALGASVASLGMLVVEFVRSTKAQDDFVRANATFGGQLGMSTEQAFAFAESFNKVETNGRKALDALTLFTKAGVSGSDSLRQYIASTIELNKYVGESIDDVAKKYAELEDAPLKALVEIAKKTGFVSMAVLENVAALEREGETAKAVALAKDAYMEANIQKTESAKESLSGMSLLWIDIKSGIDKASAAMHGMLSDTTLVNAFRTAWETVAVIVSDVWYVLKQTGKEIGGIGAQIAAVMSGDFAAAKSIGEMMKQDAATARAEQDKYTASILNRNKETEKSIGLSAEERKAQAQAAASFDKMNKLMTETNQVIEKSVTKTLSLSEFTKKYTEEKTKGLNLDKQQLALIEKAAGIEWKSMQKKGGSKEENYFESLLRSVTNEAIGAEAAQDKLTKAYTKMLEIAADPRFLKLNEDQKARVMNQLNEAHNTELATEADKRYAEGKELINKLLGKGEGLGKDYYTSLAKLEALKGIPGFDVKEIEAAQKALQATTPFAKAMSEWFAKATEAVAKSNIETKLQLANIQAQNMELDHNLAMVGLSEEAQKRLTTEFTKQRDLMKANAEYEKIRSDIMKDGSYGTDENRNKALENAASVYQATLAQINRKAVDDLFVYYTSKAAEAGKNSYGSFADVLKSAGELSFSNAVSSIGELISSFGTLIEQQTIYNKLKAEAGNDTAKLAKLDQAAAQNQMKSYGDITKSLKGFFKEGTKGYKALQTAEKVFRAFEMAMAIKNAAVKIAQEYAVMAARITGDQAATASAVASSSTIVAAKGAEANASALAAVANQGTGDPYTAFPRIAAMIAIMAGLGLMAGKSGGSGVQASNQGTGTVFGDSSAKSESIGNSLTVLEDVNTLTMRYSAEMLKSLRSIETSLAGVTNVILRSNGMELSAAGIVEGTKLSGFGALTNTVLNAFGLDKILTGVLGKLFGTKTTITGQGVMVQDASYQNILAGNVEAGYYTDVNRKGKFLGITTSDKNSTNYKADKELSDQFGKLLNGFVDTIKSAAPILGISLDTIDNNLKDFVLKIGKIDLKDLKGDEIKEKLMSVFGAAGDDLARQAMAGFEKYQQVGEGYLETIVRLASTVESVRGSLDTLNSSFVLTVDNAMELVDAFGDLDKLTTAMSDYNQSYYTEAERNATLQRQLTREFTAQNLKLPTTKEEYRKLVEAQDLNTEAGRKMYAFLLTLAPAFSEIADAAEDLRNRISESRQDLTDRILEQEAQLLEAQGKSEEAAKKRRELLDAQRARENAALMALNPELAKLAYQLWLLEDATAAALAKEQARTTAINNAYAKLQKAIQVEKEALQTRASASKELISTLTSLFNTITNAVKELYNQVDSTSSMTFAAAKAYITGVYSSVLSGGGVGDSTKLSTAVQDALSGLNASNYATKQDYDRERLRLAGQLSKIADGTKSSLTNEERILAGIEDQITALDATLEYWKNMIDIANGNYVATVSVADAVRELQNTMIGIATGAITQTNNKTPYLIPGQDGSGGSTGGGSTDTSTFGHAGPNGEWIWPDGTTSPIYVPTNPTLPMFADGGNYQGGLALVGEQGPELINFNQGGYVHTAAQTSEILSGSGGSEDSARIIALEQALASALGAIAANTKRTADTLRNISPAGDSIQVESSSFLEI